MNGVASRLAAASVAVTLGISTLATAQLNQAINSELLPP
jgi:hypothetical protein